MASSGDYSNGTTPDTPSSSSRLSSLLTSGDRDFLLTSDDTQVKISELRGNVVGIYFSANWYPACREFNQILIKVYEELKSQGCNVEIVLVSSDEDIGAFNNYRASMPWLSVPFSDLETRRSLSRIFDVEAIPCLVIFQPDQSNHNNDPEIRDGVELICRYGIQAFPFTKTRLDELLKEENEREEKQTIVNLLANQARDYLLGHPSSHQVPVTSLEGKTIGLYFSAQWCLPCVKFTPKLISIYQRVNRSIVTTSETQGNPETEEFEIVFVSSDRDKASFDTYFETMPWLALPFGDPTIKKLVKHFDIHDIPSLVILGPDGKTLTKQGRNLINLYQENGYPFTKARLELIEKEMEEEAKNMPRSAVHEGHHHELNLVSEGTGGGPFICCDCDEQGFGWAYQCLECGFEVHTKCVRPVAVD